MSGSVSPIIVDKFKIPILFAAAALGIYVGGLAAPPTWIYDNFSIRETGQELMNYRYLHTAAVYGVIVPLFTLAAARLVGLGILSMLVVSTASMYAFNVFALFIRSEVLEMSIVFTSAKFISFFLFGAFSVAGVWYFLQAFIKPARTDEDA